MMAQEAADMPDAEENEYDRRRLPGAYSQTIHHIRELRKSGMPCYCAGMPGTDSGRPR